jgi:hypothetical protein
MVINPPAGTNIHPKDWMLVQKINARLRCLELAHERYPGMISKDLMDVADSYFKWAKQEDTG